MTPTPEQIIDILADQTGIDANDITMAMPVVDLGIDSLDTVEVMMALENQYEIEIEESDFLKCVTVGDILTMVRDTLDFSEPLTAPSTCTDEGCESCQ